EIEFRDYRKFQTGFVIRYGSTAKAPPPLPKSETEEQPASASKAPPPKPAQQSTDPFALPTPPPPNPGK
ncbi:MAG: hypothetical protein ACRD45_11285, partial [Bryobacteraceae bacterium]